VLKNSPTARSFDLSDFPVGVSRFVFLSQIGTVADSRDLDLRKRASRFRFWAVAARKELFANMLHSPQAHSSQSDLVLQLRKECFYFPALALRCREGRLSRTLARPLSHRFVDMDRDLPIVTPGASGAVTVDRWRYHN
jgi:hypothetical protein